MPSFPSPHVPPPLPRRNLPGAHVARFPVGGSLRRYPAGSASALSVSRPARRSLVLRPACSLNRPWRPVPSKCFRRSRYLLRPLRLLPAGATVAGRDSHPLGNDALSRRTGYFEVACAVTSLEDWPVPEQPLSKIGPRTYLVGRDLSPGTFRGTAGDDILDSCYWARLRGVSGMLADIIANDNAIGRFFVEVAQTDYALKSGCALERVE